MKEKTEAIVWLAIFFFILGTIGLYVKLSSANTNVVLGEESVVINNFTEQPQQKFSDCEQTEQWGWLCANDVYLPLKNYTEKDYEELSAAKTLIGKGHTYWVSCSSASMYPVFTCYDTLVAIRPDNVYNLEIGNIIIYRQDTSSSKYVIHRITQKLFDVEGLYYVTKADKSSIEDGWKVRPYTVQFKIIGKLI